MILAAAGPDGALKRVAMLPADARSLVVTPGALWTANFRDSTVARIAGYVQNGRPKMEGHEFSTSATVRVGAMTRCRAGVTSHD
jgi:hypothetical protein